MMRDRDDQEYRFKRGVAAGDPAEIQRHGVVRQLQFEVLVERVADQIFELG